MKSLLCMLMLLILQNDQPETSGTSFPSQTEEHIVYFSTDEGKTWKHKSQGLPAGIVVGLGAIAVGDGLLGLATKSHGVFLYDFKKERWVLAGISKALTEGNPGALIYYKGALLAGTQHAGVFISNDKGKTWKPWNRGLTHLTIRRFMVLDGKLYAGTNGGLFSYNESGKKWEHEYGDKTLQVNGAVLLNGSIYIATNRGGFAKGKHASAWHQVLGNRSLHNIGTDGRSLYAMVYNELFSSADGGISWNSIQKGLPADFYTFNIVQLGNAVFAAQWDGVYRRSEGDNEWHSYSDGLPPRFAVTNMRIYERMIVISGSGRK